MQAPLLARSLADFWGNRWNTAFNVLADRYGFRPLTPLIGPHAALAVVFLVSGLLHEAVHVVFPQKRLKFLDKKGDPVGAPLQGQAIIYIGPNGSTFLKRFSKLGWAAQICN